MKKYTGIEEDPKRTWDFEKCERCVYYADMPEKCEHCIDGNLIVKLGTIEAEEILNKKRP